MGIITRSAANNITTGGVILPAGINDASVASVTALAQVSAGDGITLISSQTASSSASLSFTSGIDSTYRTYLFKWINCHPATDGAHFQFNATTDGTNFNVTKTSTFFRSQHSEDGTDASIGYNTSKDLAQSTSDQVISSEVGADNDQTSSGYLYLFSPSSTTYVKHFISTSNSGFAPNYSNEEFVGGYMNTTSAITGLKFLFSTGNIDAGTIHMYGIA